VALRARAKAAAREAEEAKEKEEERAKAKEKEEERAAAKAAVSRGRRRGRNPHESSANPIRAITPAQARCERRPRRLIRLHPPYTTPRGLPPSFRVTRNGTPERRAPNRPR
jgi:hypothetical protein